MDGRVGHVIMYWGRSVFLRAIVMLLSMCALAGSMTVSVFRSITYISSSSDGHVYVTMTRHIGYSKSAGSWFIIDYPYIKYAPLLFLVGFLLLLWSASDVHKLSYNIGRVLAFWHPDMSVDEISSASGVRAGDVNIALKRLKLDYRK